MPQMPEVREKQGMKAIMVSGPSGSGKDVIIDSIVSEINRERGQVLEKPLYFTTRKPRPGEQINSSFLTEEAFQQKLKAGEIMFPGENAGYHVGYPKPKNLATDKILIYNILKEGAESLKAQIELEGGEVLMVYIHAPKEMRVERIRRRDGWVIYEPAEYKVENDITSDNPKEFSNYDLIVENKEGDLEKSIQIIKDRITKFIS